jgi:hypothetical protein
MMSFPECRCPEAAAFGLLFGEDRKSNVSTRFKSRSLDFEIRMARRIELRRAISLLPPMNYELTGEPHELIQIAVLRRIRGVGAGG